jgi:hypothetical protein
VCALGVRESLSRESSARTAFVVLLAPLVAKSSVNVLLALRSPPPVRPVPAVTVVAAATTAAAKSSCFDPLIVNAAARPISSGEPVPADPDRPISDGPVMSCNFANVTASLSIVQVAPLADTVMSPLSPSLIAAAAAAACGALGTGRGDDQRVPWTDRHAHDLTSSSTVNEP